MTTLPPSGEQGASEEQISVFRVSNICCKKEIDLVYQVLEGQQGLYSCEANIVTKNVFVRHNPYLLTTSHIQNLLNSVHLGATVSATGIFDQKSSTEKSFYETHQEIIPEFYNALLFLTILLLRIFLFDPSSPRTRDVAYGVAVLLCIIISRHLFWNAYVAIVRLRTLNMQILMFVGVVSAIICDDVVDAALIPLTISIANVSSHLLSIRLQNSIQSLISNTPPLVRVRARDIKNDLPDQEDQLPVSKFIPAEDIQIGDVLLIFTGEIVPVEGKILAGNGQIDESKITGEIIPKDKKKGDFVYSGCLLVNGSMQVVALTTFATCSTSRLLETVRSTQSSLEHITTSKFIDDFAGRLLPWVFLLSVVYMGLPFILYFTPVSTLPYLSFLSPLYGRLREMSGGQMLLYCIKRLFFVLVCACPCALVLISPSVYLSAVSFVANNLKIIIKNSTAMESFANVFIAAFDKTGTLTTGKFDVIDEINAIQWSPTYSAPTCGDATCADATCADKTCADKTCGDVKGKSEHSHKHGSGTCGHNHGDSDHSHKHETGKCTHNHGDGDHSHGHKHEAGKCNHNHGDSDHSHKHGDSDHSHKHSDSEHSHKHEGGKCDHSHKHETGKCNHKHGDSDHSHKHGDSKCDHSHKKETADENLAVTPPRSGCEHSAEVGVQCDECFFDKCDLSPKNHHHHYIRTGDGNNLLAGEQHKNLVQKSDRSRVCCSQDNCITESAIQFLLVKNKEQQALSSTCPEECCSVMMEASLSLSPHHASKKKKHKKNHSHIPSIPFIQDQFSDEEKFHYQKILLLGMRGVSRLAAAVESCTSHPLASLLVSKWTGGCAVEYLESAEPKEGEGEGEEKRGEEEKESETSLPSVSNFLLTAGKGVSGDVSLPKSVIKEMETWDGWEKYGEKKSKVVIGNLSLMTSLQVKIPMHVNEWMSKGGDAGKGEGEERGGEIGKGHQNYSSVVYIAIDGVLASVMKISDIIKKDTRQTIQSLLKMNIASVVLTGDGVKSARNFQLDVPELSFALGGLSPMDKRECVVALQKIVSTAANLFLSWREGQREKGEKRERKDRREVGKKKERRREKKGKENDICPLTIPLLQGNHGGENRIIEMGEKAEERRGEKREKREKRDSREIGEIELRYQMINSDIDEETSSSLQSVQIVGAQDMDSVQATTNVCPYCSHAEINVSPEDSFLPVSATPLSISPGRKVYICGCQVRVLGEKTQAWCTCSILWGDILSRKKFSLSLPYTKTVAKTNYGVLMIGDGINDSLALATVTSSMTIIEDNDEGEERRGEEKGGEEKKKYGVVRNANMDAANCIIVGDGLNNIPRLIKVSREAYSRIFFCLYLVMGIKFLAFAIGLMLGDSNLNFFVAVSVDIISVLVVLLVAIRPYTGVVH